MPDAVELATFHLLAGEVEDALAALTVRLGAAPDDSAARRLRAETYTAQNTSESLRAALKDSMAIKAPTPDDDLRVAVIYERLGDLPRAAAALETAVRIYPDNLRLRQRWMEIAFKTGNLSMAREAVQGVADDWRMLEQAADLTVGYASATGEDDELLTQAVALYDHALRELPSGEWNRPFRARLFLARAGVYLRLNMPDEVAHDADSAAKLIPSEPACHFYVGWSLVKRGSIAEGLARVKRALRSASEPVRDALWETISRDEDFQDVAKSLL
ncbi:MAG: hypothetical protein IPK52_11390 [Chloroflexi bacterium]|nr:hypothetical protein [Chloroflexota bacterium]